MNLSLKHVGEFGPSSASTCRHHGVGADRFIRSGDGSVWRPGAPLSEVLAFILAVLAAMLVFQFSAAAGQPAEGARSIYECAGVVQPAGRIDELVFAQLRRLKIQPVLCSDAVFVRRVYLDVTGTLPTAKEAREFIGSRAGDKRAALIDRLLESESFADYWSMKWADTLRIKAEFPINLWPNAAQAYHRWVRTAIARNLPYDQFARELLTSSGSNFRVGPVNFYRAMQNRTPEGIAGAVALTFMGARLEAWPANCAENLAVFFSQIGYKPTGEWKEEHVFWDPMGTSVIAGNSAPGKASLTRAPGESASNEVACATSPAAVSAAGEAVFPDGSRTGLSPDTDPRDTFADWLLKPGNRWFARCGANRVWAWLMGRGIVHEPDGFRDDNPPANPALLDCLTREFAAGGYDMKKLCRLILTSRTYQLSSVPRHRSPAAVANFAAYPLRRLDAEVLIDAINHITGTTELYTSPIPEPFTYIPENVPAVAIGDGSITSPFLALFGRPARATGMDNERNNRPLPAQWLHLLNSSHIQGKLEKGSLLTALFAARQSEADRINELYLTILSRFPTDDEVRKATAHLAAAGAATGKSSRNQTRSGWVDLAWALVNTTEFSCRH